METGCSTSVGRRSVLKGSVVLAGLWPLPSLANATGRTVGQDGVRRLRSAAGVEATRHGDVALISLNRPFQDNFLEEGDYADLLAAFQAVDEDASIQSAVLNGRGEHFSLGMVAPATHVNEMLAAEAHEGSRRLSSKPLVSVVQGRAVGLGTVLPLCADVRIANADAVFSWPDPHHADLFRTRLAEDIGRANAQRFLMTGDGLDAHEAWRLGLVQHVAADQAEALDRAMAIAGSIARRRVEQRSLA